MDFPGCDENCGDIMAGFNANDRVTIHGLISRPELNGKDAFVTEATAEGMERVPVTLVMPTGGATELPGATIAVKRANLRLAEPAGVDSKGSAQGKSGDAAAKEADKAQKIVDGAAKEAEKLTGDAEKKAAKVVKDGEAAASKAVKAAEREAQKLKQLAAKAARDEAKAAAAAAK